MHPPGHEGPLTDAVEDSTRIFARIQSSMALAALKSHASAYPNAHRKRLPRCGTPAPELGRAVLECVSCCFRILRWNHTRCPNCSPPPRRQMTPRNRNSRRSPHDRSHGPGNRTTRVQWRIRLGANDDAGLDQGEKRRQDRAGNPECDRLEPDLLPSSWESRTRPPWSLVDLACLESPSSTAPNRNARSQTPGRRPPQCLHTA